MNVPTITPQAEVRTLSSFKNCAVDIQEIMFVSPTHIIFRNGMQIVPSEPIRNLRGDSEKPFADLFAALSGSNPAILNPPAHEQPEPGNADEGTPPDLR